MVISYLFLAIFLGISNGPVTGSSLLAIPSAANPKNAGSMDLFAEAIIEHNNKKALEDRVKELELQFQLHVTESKAESENQFEKIVILQAAKKSQEEKYQLLQNEIKILKGQNRDQMVRIGQLEEILKTKSDTSSSATSSIQSATNKPNNDNGLLIPSSCEDLKSSGHHFNGIYMVFDSNVKKILATYCDFHQSPTTIEKRVIGSLNINTMVGGVYFYAQMKKTFKEIGKTIPFDRILVNQGNALHPSIGVFTAPRTGIYHFTFKGHTVFNTNRLTVEIRHNGVAVGDASLLSGNLNVHATLKLKAGDRIYLFKTSGGDLYTEGAADTHFSGWLLEEDVSMLNASNS